MRIATYNIWNEPKNMNDRYAQIATQIKKTDADVIGLQEVTPNFFAKLRTDLSYDHSVYAQYIDEEEGLAIFSKYPIVEEFSLANSKDYAHSAALNVRIQNGGFTYSVTNIHLPWQSILEKEKQITQIDQYIKSQRHKADFCLLMGDFNCTLSSSVHAYLLGEASLLGRESVPYWFDLASTYAAIAGEPNRPTLDFLRNPRWGGKNTTEIPAVYDRILIMNSYGRDYDETIHHVEIFGTEVSGITKLAPSDHYGVVADVSFFR